MAAGRLDIDDTTLLVVDMQEKLMPHVHDSEEVVDRATRLIRGARALELPAVATEQYRQGLGPTVPTIDEALGSVERLEKMRFSAWVEPVRTWLTATGRGTVVLCGIEAHVCVVQTAADLIDAGWRVAVAGDAVGARRPVDRDLAFRRLDGMGAMLVSAEMALLELVEEAGTERFKAILPVIK